MSAGSRDDALMRVYYALEKLGWFTYEFLSNATWEDIFYMQIVFLYCGVNYFTEGPCSLVGMAKRIKHFYSGCLPTRPEDWALFYGVAWKVECLIFQDGMRDPRQVVNLLAIIDIVPDTHVKEGARSFRWSRFPKEEQIGKDLQKWIPKELWKVVNEYFGGLCQIWEQADVEQQRKMVTLAEEKGVKEHFVSLVTKTRLPSDEDEEATGVRSRRLARVN